MFYCCIQLSKEVRAIDCGFVRTKLKKYVCHRGLSYSGSVIEIPEGKIVLGVNAVFIGKSKKMFYSYWDSNMTVVGVNKQNLIVCRDRKLFALNSWKIVEITHHKVDKILPGKLAFKSTKKIDFGIYRWTYPQYIAKYLSDDCKTIILTILRVLYSKRKFFPWGIRQMICEYVFA